MIYNNSNDPVLIKKISLKLWSLREEIEARLQAKIESGELDPENAGEFLAKMQKEYTPKQSEIPDNVLVLNEAKKSSESEEALASESEVANALSDDKTISDTTEESPLSSLSSMNEENKKLGKTILSEINMDRMFFFSNHAFTEGQSVVVQFCIPKTFIVHAEVIYCRPFSIKSRIISKNNFSHRMLVKFTFLKEGERTLLRQFIQSIEPDAKKNQDDDNEAEPSNGSGQGLDEIGP